MSDRDQLAAILRDHAMPGGEADFPPGEYECCAEAIVHAGWRPPPRRIEDHAGLEALPAGTIIIEEEPDYETDPNPCTWFRRRLDGGELTWEEFGSDRHWDSSDVSLPAVVVWPPGGEA